MVSKDSVCSHTVSTFSCDQAALGIPLASRLSICLSACLSVTPFSQCPCHCIIMKFSGVITIDESDVHGKGKGQRSNVKVTEVKTQLNCFRTVTPVWIHIWWWNDAPSLTLLGRGALLLFKVIHQISRSFWVMTSKMVFKITAIFPRGKWVIAKLAYMVQGHVACPLLRAKCTCIQATI